MHNWLFDGSYVNLEQPCRRTEIGFDYRELALDLVNRADGSEWWKDEDELREVVRRGVLSEEEARALRAEGERVLARYEAGEPPFSDGWERWRPDPTWPVAQLPEGWDRV